MATSDFWRDLAVQFLALPDPSVELRVDWLYEVGSGELGSWTVTGIANVFLQNQFEALARRGAMEIANERGAELLIAWLEALKKDGEGFRFTGNGGLIDDVTTGKGIEVMLGTIRRVCEASASFCKKQESRALQAEFEEKQRNDPQNWSALRRQFEAFRGIKQVMTGPHQTITESFVREVLARQYGVAPEEVTWGQIQFEVAGLLRDYPAITLVPSTADDNSVQEESSVATPPRDEKEITRRERLLADYKTATGNPSNKRIYEAKNSGIHKPQFYEWIKGKLPADSATSQNFERFLKDKKPPIPRA